MCSGSSFGSSGETPGTLIGQRQDGRSLRLENTAKQLCYGTPLFLRFYREHVDPMKTDTSNEIEQDTCAVQQQNRAKSTLLQAEQDCRYAAIFCFCHL